MKQVRVRWTDAVGGPSRWQSKAELRAGLRKALAHTTLGFVALEDRRSVTVCGSRQDAQGSYLGCISIPRHAIKKMERLR